MKSITALAAMLGAISAGGASAQTAPAPTATAPAAPAVRGTPPPKTDANCILVANVFASQLTNADQKSLSQNVLFYYFGRLDARTNEGQMKAELRQARGIQLTNDTAGALMNNCVQGMQTRAKTFETIMQQLGSTK